MLGFKRICFRGDGRGGGQLDVYISSTTAVTHTTTTFKSSYMMDLWVDLMLNQCVSIQYAINYGVSSHKSILYSVSTDGTRLILEKSMLTTINNYYKAILMQFVPAKVEIGAIIRNIIAEKPSSIFTINNSP